MKMWGQEGAGYMQRTERCGRVDERELESQARTNARGYTLPLSSDRGG